MTTEEEVPRCRKCTLPIWRSTSTGLWWTVGEVDHEACVHEPEEPKEERSDSDVEQRKLVQRSRLRSA